MKQSLPHIRISLIGLGLIILLAVALRFYRLHEIPAGLYWDEAAIVYNAFGIATWNRDEYGTKLPVSFRSYGDYKAPLLIYSLGMIYKITGLQIDYLRFIVASLGVANVILVMLIAKRVFTQSAPIYWSGVAMAFVPWSLHFSRFGAEAVLALTCLLIAGWLALTYTKTYLHWLLIAVSATASLYAYHSSKIVTPLTAVLFMIILLPKVSKHMFPKILVAALVGLVLSLPLMYDTFSGQAFERGKTLIIFEQGQLKPVAAVATDLLNNLATTFSPAFWFQGKDVIGLRHGAPGHGFLFYTVIILIFIALWWGIRKRSKEVFILSLLAVIGWLPSLLTTDHPHAIRAMMSLPPLILLSATGINTLATMKPLALKRGVFAGVITLFLIESLLYLNAYFGEYATQSALAFQYGYRQAIQSAEVYGRSAETITVTTAYGQPYIYALLYRGITPQAFTQGALANYAFHEINWPDDRPARVFVATPFEIPVSDPRVVEVITLPDSNQAVFVIAKNP
jgi:hypothetical protein